MRNIGRQRKSMSGEEMAFTMVTKQTLKNAIYGHSKKVIPVQES